MEHFDFEYLEGAGGLAELRTEWKQLQAETPDISYYQTYEWHDSVLTNLLARASTTFYIAAYLGRNLRGVFPLRWSMTRAMGLPIRTLTFNIHPHISRHDFLVDPAFEQAVCWKSLISFVERCLGYRFDRLDLRGLSENSCAHRVVRGNKAIGAAPPQVGEAAIIDCAGTFDENKAVLPARAARNIRRLERRALQRSDVKFSSYRGHEITEDVITSFMEIEDDGWKGLRMTSILSDLSLQRFYASLVNNLDKPHECQINTLSVADVDVATQFGIVSNDVFHILKIGYRQEYADIGPGNLILYYAVRDSSEDDSISAINLQTDRDWSRYWASETEQYYRHIIFQPTLSGCMLYLSASGRRLARQLVNGIQRIISRSMTQARKRAASNA